MKGLFRDDLESAAVISLAGKFAIQAKYTDGTEEILSQSFKTEAEAQKQIDETRKAKNS